MRENNVHTPLIQQMNAAIESQSSPMCSREIYPGAHQIVSRFGDRWLFQYLFVGEIVVLLDTGIHTTPVTAIFPYMEKLGLAPRRLTLALTLHADLDHQGGNFVLRDASSATLLACHRADRALIENPEKLYARRLNHLARRWGAGMPRDYLAYAGRPAAIQVAFSGGERLRLGPDWQLEIWHVPGHSQGHLAVYDARHRAAFTSDAVQALGCPTISGGLAFAPTYYAVGAYLSTIHFLEQMPIEHLYTGHWPEAHGAQVSEFLAASRGFVERVEEWLPRILRAHPRGATLNEIIAAIAPRLGDWPRAQDTMLQWALHGHLVRLRQRGLVQADKNAPARWFWQDNAQR